MLVTTEYNIGPSTNPNYGTPWTLLGFPFRLENTSGISDWEYLFGNPCPYDSLQFYGQDGQNQYWYEEHGCDDIQTYDWFCGHRDEITHCRQANAGGWNWDLDLNDCDNWYDGCCNGYTQGTGGCVWINCPNKS